MSDQFGFSSIAIQIPQILLPAKQIDLSKWAVVACDQYTSQPDYWARVKETTDNQPSSLNVIFPEVYLEDNDGEQRIININQTMADYLNDGTLSPLAQPSFVLVDRKTSQVPSRKGLVVSIDLEAYDFTKGSSSLIRATEGTIVDRLPPRIKVRKDADIEMPHIMVLIDDPDKTVIEPLFNEALETLYDFELMEKSGHIKGLLVDQDKHLQQVADALKALAAPSTFADKYDAKGHDVLLYAMGDGNHSLATAKAIWEQLKEEADDKEAILSSPSRYALVELVNIHDEGLIFEPIHRVLFDIDSDNFLDFCQQPIERFSSKDAMLGAIKNIGETTDHIIPFNDAKGYGYINIENPKFTLELASFEDLLSQYQQQHPDVKVDFIHGDDVVDELGVKEGNMGLFFPPISKHSLFKTIIFDGALPRKTFSMGEADEKRFYMEARKIK
ncbi:MAG: DUF1015 domain-containing protein [Gammaproteobacteria bacterium]|nr:DUF1015 domain-containing protein [Gammaproteobacteria bacterium]